MSGAKIFNKIDLIQGYNQLEQVFNLSWSSTISKIELWNQLGCRIKNTIREALSGLKETLNIGDDILIYGTDDDDHDAYLEAALERLRERGLTLNKGKCVVGKESLIFQGYFFSEHGISFVVSSRITLL